MCMPGYFRTSIYTVITVLAMAPTDGITQRSQPSVTFRLGDNTNAGYRIDNIISASRVNIEPIRVLLKPDTYFELSTKGDLYTKVDIDRDTLCGQLGCCSMDTCKLPMTAYVFDKSELNPLAITILVEVADENDNAPQFSQTVRRLDQKTGQNISVWELRIPESVPVGSQHALPSALDPDSPRFGVRVYKLYSGEYSGPQGIPVQSPFSLVEDGDVSPGQAPLLQVDRPLDRETKASYDLSLIAEDAGASPHLAKLHVVVRIVDINDNPPMFITPESQLIRIPENLSVGSVINRFSTEDPDEGVNGNVSLSINWLASTHGLLSAQVQQLSRKYALSASTGELRIIRPLDYEQDYERMVVLVIKASDHGIPALTASTSVTISLLDVNDNPPLIQVEPADATAGDSKQGDHGHLVENQSKPKLLRLISVSDPDSVSTGKLSCHLTESVQENQFKLKFFSSTMYGLFNVRAFDFEKDASPSGHISVSVECIDRAEPQMRSQEWIQIPLVDVNDNWPQFDSANYQFYVEEDIPVGTEIGRISATDKDFGEGGKITYKLSADEDHLYAYVSIDSKTGILRTGYGFDREKLPRIDFHVTANDGGDRQQDDPHSTFPSAGSVKTNTTSVTIFVLDVNDNGPVYVGPTEVHISEMAPVGTEILAEINFIDADLGANGTVTVSLVDQFYDRVVGGGGGAQKYGSKPNLLHEGQPALVSIIAGSRLVTLTSLDREIAPRLIVSLVAKDNGRPRALSTTTSLTVIVDDVNDNAPELTYPRNATILIGLTGRGSWLAEGTASTVPADTPVGSLLATIRGTDIDTGENATVTYHMVKGPSSAKVFLRDTMETDHVARDNHLSLPDGYHYFRVDKVTGHLTTAWGGSLSEHESRGQLTNSSGHSTSSIQTVIPSVEPPLPGLYVLRMELRDAGIPQQRTKVIFYVNISEALGTASAFSLFNQLSLSNIVIFALIAVCSITLIVSLTAAIFWVRYRGNNRRPTGPYTSSYCGPSVTTYDLPHNGYFYSAHFPTLGGIGSLTDLEPGFAQPSGGQSLDGFEFTRNGMQTKVTDSELPTYFSNAELQGPHTPISPSVTGRLPQPSGQFSTLAYPLQYGVFPTSSTGEPAPEVAFLPLANTTANWQYRGTPYDQALVMSPSPVTVGSRSMFGMLCPDANGHHNEYGTNRSNGGSDSGVDSGGAAMNGSLAPTTNSSPSRDPQRAPRNTLVSSAHTSVDSFACQRGRVTSRYPQGLREVKSFGTTDPVFEVDCSSSALSGAVSMAPNCSAAEAFGSPKCVRNYPAPTAIYVPSDTLR